MALSSLALYKAAIGYTATARDHAYAALLAAVEQAVKNRCRKRLEPETYTVVLTPPPSARLALRQTPVRSVTSLWVNAAANGDPAAFTSDHLLTPYTDYWLEVGEDGMSHTGIVWRVGGRAWGAGGMVGGGSLAAWTPAVSPVLLAGGGGLTRSITPNPGSVKVTYAAGYPATPEPVLAAIHMAVSRLFDLRRTGVGLGSESWNGYSRGLAAVDPKAVAGVLSSPEIHGLLAPYIDAPVGGLF